MEVTVEPDSHAAAQSDTMHPGQPSLRQRAYAYLRMTRPELAVMGMVSVYIGAFATMSQDILLAMPAVFLITAGSMAFNDYFDRDLDRAAHPTRPIPSGVLRPSEALWLSISFFAVAVALSVFINPWCVALSVFGIAFLVLYETRFKRRGFLGNLVVAVLSSMAFIFGGTAAGRPWGAGVLSVMAFFVLLGREILMDTRDMPADTVNRVTLPMRIGQRSAVRVGAALAAVTIVLTPLPVALGILDWWYLALFIPADALLAYGIALALEDVDRAGRVTDLFRVAMAVALAAFYLGVAV